MTEPREAGAHEAARLVSERLHVNADLHLDIDGVQVQVSGSGSRLDARVDDVRGLLRAVNSSAIPGGGLRGALPGLAADALADAGVRVTLTGPSGEVVRIGDGVESRFGRLFAGSTHLRPTLSSGNARDVVRVATAGASARRLAGAAAAVGAVAAVVAVAARRRSG